MRAATSRMPSAFQAFLIALVTFTLAACETVPATGERQVSLLGTQEQQRIGREQHPEILRQFGGEYDDRRLQAYVQRIGDELVARSETPGERYTFTVLNSDMVNAMALPGGYVYVTRGLIALARDEAELAGVIAHEIGHVTGRHASQRYSRAVMGGLGAQLLGVAVGSPAAADVAQVGASLYLQGYSRQQEFEADSLGVRYLARTGYDPGAMASFLDQMARHDQVRATIEGRPSGEERYNFMSTHPRTSDRIREAMTVAGVRAGDGARNEDRFLDHIDGMLYGDDPAQGIVRDTLFEHPDLRFRFRVPDGFYIMNGETQVIARGPDDTIIAFDTDRRGAGLPIRGYLTDSWGARANLRDVETFTVNGMDAATGVTRASTQAGTRDVRMVAIAFDRERVYRFMFLTSPQQTARFEDAFRQTTFSFERLSQAEAERIRPLRVRVTTVRSGDTAESLSRQMPYGAGSANMFRALNGLGPGEQPSPGTRVKTIVDG